MKPPVQAPAVRRGLGQRLPAAAVDRAPLLPSAWSPPPCNPKTQISCGNGCCALTDCCVNNACSGIQRNGGKGGKGNK
jgi:hypothetical protein